MKRKVTILLVSVACMMLFLSGGKPKLISEDEAKKAGLAFINHVFDAKETEAVVNYRTHAGASYVDGEYLELELSSQVQRLTEENFIRRLPVKAFARSKVKFLNK